MDLKQHVTSLALSRELAEAGLTDDTLFCWVERNGVWRLLYREHYTFLTDTIPAYTASELGRMLPAYIDLDDGNPAVMNTMRAIANEDCELLPEPWGWLSGYATQTETIYRFVADTEADARARLLLALIDAGHVRTHERV